MRNSRGLGQENSLPTSKLHFVQLTRQEPLGSLQNSHFANAKPRFLRPPITFHGGTCRERQLAPLFAEYKEKSKKERKTLSFLLMGYEI